MTIEHQISNTERQVQAAKFRIKELRSKAWQQTQKPNNQKTDFEPQIAEAQTALDTNRQKLAKLIVQFYNLSL